MYLGNIDDVKSDRILMFFIPDMLNVSQINE